MIAHKKSPQSVDTERRNGGRPQAVSSSPCPGEELPLWSKLRKFLPSVDTERRNGYNTYRARPKRSANKSVLANPFIQGNNRTVYGRAVISF